MALHNEHHREVIVTTEKYPVRFFRSRDRGSYVPYHYHDAFEFIYLTRGTMSLSSLPNHHPLSCFIAKLPALPQKLPIKISFAHDAEVQAAAAQAASERAAAIAAAAAEAAAAAAAEEAERRKLKELTHIGLAEQNASSLAPLLDSATSMRPSSSHPQDPRLMGLIESMDKQPQSLRAQAEAKLFATTPEEVDEKEPAPAPASAPAPATTEATTTTAATASEATEAKAQSDSAGVVGDWDNLKPNALRAALHKANHGWAKGLVVHPAWQDPKDAATKGTSPSTSASSTTKDGAGAEASKATGANAEDAGDSDEMANYSESSNYEMSSFNYNFALINSNEMHASSCQSFNEAYVLQIPEKFFIELCGYSEAFPLYLNPHLASKECLERFSRAYLRLAVVHEHYQERPGFLIHFNHALYAILECLMDMIVPVATLNQLQDDLNCSLMRSANLRRLQPVFDFLKYHYHERIKLEQMAAVAHLHPGYFCQFFKDAVGMSPINYLSELRLCHIYYDLSERKEPISEILQRHGYTNAKKFYRLFKERFGKSPTEVRQSHSGHTLPSHRGYSYFERLYHQSPFPDDTAMALGLSPESATKSDQTQANPQEDSSAPKAEAPESKAAAAATTVEAPNKATTPQKRAKGHKG